MSKLGAQIDAMVTGQQILPTRAPGLTIYKHCGPAARMQIVYRPSLCVVAQGEKIAHIGKQRIRYNARRFFFTCMPVPAELYVQRATRQKPLLGLILEIDVEQLSRLCLEIAEVRRPVSGPPGPATFAGPLGSELSDALYRLLACTTDEVRHHVLYAGTLREVLFMLLTGPQGERLRQLSVRRDSTHAIIESARLMDRAFEQRFSIPALARKAGMSPSTYYQRFRDVTALSPLQYLKRIRLHQARALIVSGTAITQAAFEVGYASASQFSRDFRALFGAPPSAMATGRYSANDTVSVGAAVQPS